VAIDNLGQAIQDLVPSTKGYELCVCPGNPKNLVELSKQLTSDEVQMSEKIKCVVESLSLVKMCAK